MKPITVTSPAKINLMLRILGQKKDGYHELQSCFKLLPWGDKMQFNWGEKQTEPNIEIIGFPHLQKEKNLIYQAAWLLVDAANFPRDVTITVEKHIPEGGGMGGGSSNAATTLRVLNEVWQCNKTVKELMALGLTLGADVPFFLFARDALATGVGEQLVSITLKTQYILLLFPDCEIPTASIFQHKDLKRDQKMVSTRKAEQQKHWINDCLPVVLESYPQVNQVFQKMSVIGKVFLSGTGATLFMLFDDKNMAEQAKKMAQTICSCHLLLTENNV